MRVSRETSESSHAERVVLQIRFKPFTKFSAIFSIVKKCIYVFTLKGRHGTACAKLLEEISRSLRAVINYRLLWRFFFGSNPNQAAHLLSLILAGDKTATSSAVIEYEATKTPMPERGSLSIVLDGHGQPGCIIETHAVQKLPFSEMNFALCSKEGEDDNLKSWQTKHLKFFKEIAQEFGQEFTDQSEIIFEEFRVIYSS